MRRLFLRLLVTLLTFTLGATTSVVRFRWCAAAKPLDIPAVEVWPGPEGHIEADPIQRLVASETDPDLPPSLDPRDIAAFADNQEAISLTKLWQALGVDPEKFEGLEMGAGSFPHTCYGCEAEIWDFDLDGEPGTELLLRIAGNSGYASRYLVFKWKNKDWKLLGHIDAQGKYREPQHFVILSGGRTWLAIRSQGASGSGLASFIDFVYLVTPTKVLPGFSYLAEGIETGDPEYVGKQVKGTVLECSLVNGVVSAKLNYSVAYGSTETMLTKHDQVGLTNRLGRFATRFDAARSNITGDEFEIVYHVDTLGNEDFPHYNYRELSEIASGPETKKKVWLRSVLEHCGTTVQHRRLAHLLSQ